MNPDLWRTHPTLALLSWLPVPLGTLAVLLPLWPPFARRFARPAAGWAFFVLTRVVLGAIVFGAFQHRSWDWQGYIQIGQAALAGLTPYRDFATLYAPGLPYLLALGVLLSPTFGPLVLFVAADLGAWLALGRLSNGLAPRRDSAAWAYLAFPPVWYFETRYAQEEAIAALFLALALVALARGRGARAGAALAVGQLVTKILFGLCALPILLARGARRSTWLVYAGPVALVYGAMTLMRIPWTREALVQAGAFGTGPTLWRLPALWWGFDLGRMAMLPFIILFVSGGWRLIRRGADAVAHAAWLWGCFALLAPKLLPMYVVMVAPALALWVARGGGGRLVWWALYGFAMATAWYADSGPVQGLLGPAWVAPAAAALALVAALDLWLLMRVAKDEAVAVGP
ncbi:MAG: hypothetical protein HYR74_05515 [Candidatus Eisenbacteria bacterium]|nr:hypothetical protein [Candidatus Eisenbacteria bacterium]